ncbi:MAG: hypothetical protein JO008_04440 [Alphaproteobacteria bacterium]|nr:hypothetical protein [Alphaproteobacteria bacterium]MBV9964925.1 hypothetical protein [Alphaproteobacteria bacterium]
MPFDGAGFVTEPLQKLDAVIDLLGSADRWCKGALRSHDGRYCIRGAIRAVSGTEILEPAILQAIVQVAGRRFRRIEAFNDHPNTSHDEVIAVLNRARHNLEVGPSSGASRLSQPAASLLARCRGTVVDWVYG